MQSHNVERRGLFVKGVELALSATAAMMSNMKRIITSRSLIDGKYVKQNIGQGQISLSPKCILRF
ncbi:MAG: hypothetical protein BVN29_11005 [Nitrospira sp. ST-bin5]|nr:MAG: hypothetical protein BVN29_11005 [Nitrospira sp. ST-bin5]